MRAELCSDKIDHFIVIYTDRSRRLEREADCPALLIFNRLIAVYENAYCVSSFKNYTRYRVYSEAEKKGQNCGMQVMEGRHPWFAADTADRGLGPIIRRPKVGCSYHDS